jgi:hypothetical protein
MQSLAGSLWLRGPWIWLSPTARGRSGRLVWRETRPHCGTNRFAHFLRGYCAEWLRRVEFIQRLGGLREGVQCSATSGGNVMAGRRSVARLRLREVNRATSWPAYSWPGRRAKRRGTSRRSTFPRGCSFRALRGLAPSGDSASSRRSNCSAES